MGWPLNGKRIYVAGHRGMVGAALVRRLEQEDCAVLTAPRTLDLREQAVVREWFTANQPDGVIIAAARVGGIHANDTRPAEFLYDNLMIEANLVAASHAAGVEKLLFLGSSCIYPKFANQPITEEALLTGALEPTNEAYAIAKIAGLKLCAAYRRQYGCDYISAMPTNLYGPGDNYDLTSSHVIPALLRKAHEAKLADAPLTVWGSGSPRREFLHVDDCADACVHLLAHYSGEGPINLGWGKDIAIGELAALIQQVVGHQGELVFDASKPDGTPRKLLDTAKLAALGWTPRIGLSEGLADAYRHFLADHG